MHTLIHIILLKRWLCDERALPSPRRAVELLTLAAAHSPEAFAMIDLRQLVAYTQLVGDDEWSYAFQSEVMRTVWRVLLADVAEPDVPRYLFSCCPWLPAYQGSLHRLLHNPPARVIEQVVGVESRHHMSVHMGLALVLQGATTTSLLRTTAAHLVTANVHEQALADHIFDDGLPEKLLCDMIVSAGFQRAWAQWSFCEAIRLTPSLALPQAAALNRPAL